MLGWTPRDLKEAAAECVVDLTSELGRPPTGDDIREVMSALDGLRTELAVLATVADKIHDARGGPP